MTTKLTAALNPTTNDIIAVEGVSADFARLAFNGGSPTVTVYSDAYVFTTLADFLEWEKTRPVDVKVQITLFDGTTRDVQPFEVPEVNATLLLKVAQLQEQRDALLATLELSMMALAGYVHQNEITRAACAKARAAIAKAQL